MRYDITNIPIAEVFEEMDGCPICRLRNTLENRAVEYITGAAMMEPDVRIETNKKGFCLDHYRQILGQRNRLSVALMLESHLEEVEKQIFSGPPLLGKNAKKQAKSAGRTGCTCFVCEQMEDAMEKMLAKFREEKIDGLFVAQCNFGSEILVARLAKALGFNGKASISPRHVEVINSVFSPTEQEIEYAYEVMDAIELAKRQGKGAIALHGKMIDAPIVARAQRTIDMAKALGLGREDA